MFGIIKTITISVSHHFKKPQRQLDYFCFICEENFSIEPGCCLPPTNIDGTKHVCGKCWHDESLWD